MSAGRKRVKPDLFSSVERVFSVKTEVYVVAVETGVLETGVLETGVLGAGVLGAGVLGAGALGRMQLSVGAALSPRGLQSAATWAILASRATAGRDRILLMSCTASISSSTPSRGA
jgi:hypothetical protein